jgi:hypothetical protein
MQVQVQYSAGHGTVPLRRSRPFAEVGTYLAGVLTIPEFVVVGYLTVFVELTAPAVSHRHRRMGRGGGCSRP